MVALPCAKESDQCAKAKMKKLAFHDALSLAAQSHWLT
jgi:hypothetical protein